MGAKLVSTVHLFVVLVVYHDDIRRYRKGKKQARTCHPGLFNVNQVGLEETFRCLKSFRANLDHPSIWELLAHRIQWRATARRIKGHSQCSSPQVLSSLH